MRVVFRRIEGVFALHGYFIGIVYIASRSRSADAYHIYTDLR